MTAKTGDIATSGSKGAFVDSFPTSPALYYSNAGNDGADHTGAIGDPLATPHECVRRLGITKWLVEAFVRALDLVDLGANPILAVPAPVGSALPICFQTTYVTDIAGVACTGGTLGSSTAGVAVVGGTFTSAAAGAANDHRGKILSVTAGPAIIGTRYEIHSNDGAGGFAVPMKLAAAPVAGNTFDVISRAGQWTWSGTFTMLIESAVLIDGMEFRPTGAGSVFLAVGGLLQESATRWVTVATATIAARNCAWKAGSIAGSISPAPTAASRQDFNPTGITPCGVRYDAAGGILTLFGTGGFGDAASLSVGMASMQNVSGIFLSQTPVGFQLLASSTLNSGFAGSSESQMMLSAVRMEAGRKAVSSSIFTGIIGLIRSGVNVISTVSFDTPAITDDLISLAAGAAALVSGCQGAAGAAGKLFVNLISGGPTLVDGGGNVATGGTVGTDIAVEGGVGFPVASLSIYKSIAASNGTWLASTDNSAGAGAIARTVNKLSGRDALAIASGAVFTLTNSLIRAGDDVYVQLIAPVTAAIDPVVAVTDNACVITFAAAAAGTTQKFSWFVKKSSV